MKIKQIFIKSKQKSKEKNIFSVTKHTKNQEDNISEPQGLKNIGHQISIKVNMEMCMAVPLLRTRHTGITTQVYKETHTKLFMITMLTWD